MEIRDIPDGTNLLEVKGLEVHYIVDKDVSRAVNGVSFVINEGETLGLVGETGAGKTTTALSLIGLLPMPPGKIVRGEILYRGNNLVGQNERHMRQKRGRDITMIFQDPMTSLNPLISVGNQIMEVVLLHENLSKLEATKKAKMMLETVGIPGDRYNDFPYQFSGGMKQRVMIAMALACDPRLLIADEPTTALDVTIQAQVLKLMNNLKKERNTAVLLITHDLGVVAEVCNNVAVMYAGHIVENGSVEQIFNDMRHPYTQGLFFAIPDLDSESEFLESLEGLMPDPMHLPEGCPFHPRCRHCMEKCKTQVPQNLEVTPGHLVKCHLYSQ